MDRIHTGLCTHLQHTVRVRNIRRFISALAHANCYISWHDLIFALPLPAWLCMLCLRRHSLSSAVGLATYFD